jgi:hypothetical protein
MAIVGTLLVGPNPTLKSVNAVAVDPGAAQREESSMALPSRRRPMYSFHIEKSAQISVAASLFVPPSVTTGNIVSYERHRREKPSVISGSESTLVHRFSDFTGQKPLLYLAKW